jgi:homoserine O-acetyltransferase
MLPAHVVPHRAPKDAGASGGLSLTHQTIAPFSIVYETFGELNADRSNAILVCHALSASARRGQVQRRSRREVGLVGWPHRLRQDDRSLEVFFVVCVTPGSPFGTTAPKSIHPATGKPYGSHYPWPTIEDMVETQKPS